MKGDIASSSDDERATMSGDASVTTPLFSKDKICELKNSCYVKKKIISALKKSLKTNNNRIHHTLTLNDVSVSEEKEIGNGYRQSLNIRIDLNDKLFYSSQDASSAATGGAMNIETFKLNDSTPVGKCSHCAEKQNLVKDEETWRAYFVCVKCGKREERRWAHDMCKEKCCKSTSIYCDNCLSYKLTSNDHNFEVLQNAKFAKYMYVVTCPNGGGISLHMDYEKIMNLTPDEQRCVAKEFLKEAFKEDKRGFAQFTIAIVHNGSSYMPDLLKLLSELHPTLPVKTTKLKCNTETEVMDLGTYYTKVKETYNNGTFAFGPLNETQAASVKNDECGAYLPELLSLLEKSPFLCQVLPWSSEMTTKRFKSPHESDDGPIFWCRPGEQIVSLDRNSKRNRWNADEIETFLKERQQNLKSFCEKRYIVEELKKYRRSYSSREFLFEDRTRPHADQVWGNHFEPTAAVGVIQAIHPDEIPEQNRACKEIVMFHAKHFEMLEALLHIDVTAAPKQQCAEWLDDAKLNMIRQMNIRFSKLHLYDNDIYFIPRKIVHQFKTTSATLSVAWHTRLVEYYLEPDPPVKEDPIDETEEQAVDSDQSSSSRSSSSSPVRKKTTTAKKRKLSCSDNEAAPATAATPKKKKKQQPPQTCKSRSPSPPVTPMKKRMMPRSRSGTPLKRDKVATPKKAKTTTTKTPRKNATAAINKTKTEPIEEPTITSQEPASKRRSRSKSASKDETKKDSRCGSPVRDVEEQRPYGDVESKKKSRSSSPVLVPAPATAQRRSASRSVSRERTKKKKSRSGSKSPKRKDRSVSGNEAGDVSDEKKKKKKTKHRSRSRSRKRDDTSSGSRHEKPSSAKKKKKDRSRSPKRQRDKSKESKDNRATGEKSRHSGAGDRQSSKSKKHDRKESIRSRSASPSKNRDKTKKSASNVASPTERREKSKSIEMADVSLVDVKPTVTQSPTHSAGSRSTRRSVSPEINAVSDDRSNDVPVESATVAGRSPQHIEETRLHVSPPQTIEATESPADPTPLCGAIKREPRSPSPDPVLSIKQEPNSPCPNVPTPSTLDEPPPESLPLVKAEPHSSPKYVDNVKPAESKKPAKTAAPAQKDAQSHYRKDKRLWDAPLFSFDDCDKFVMTTRPNSTKNGDKIVKSKNANSLPKADADKIHRPRSKSPPQPPRPDKACKPETAAKPKHANEEKNHVSEKAKATVEKNDKEKSRVKEKKSSAERAKEGCKESHSSTKEPSNNDRKSSHSSARAKDKSSTELADKAKEKSSRTRDDAAASGTDDRSKRSRSPADKHRHSKKHKKHRSHSRSRTAAANDDDRENVAKPDQAVVDNAATNVDATTRVANESASTPAEHELMETYATGYQLIYPRVEIVDIGSTLAKKNDIIVVEDSDSSVTVEPDRRQEEPIVVDESVTASDRTSEDE